MDKIKGRNNKRILEDPTLRACLLGSIADLADRETQIKEWTSKTAAHRFWDTLYMSFESLDDFNLFDEDEKRRSGIALIGSSVYDQKELDAICPVIEAFQRVLDEIGTKQPDSAYINSPLWDDVVRTANHAFDVLMENEPPDSIFRQVGYYFSKKRN